MNTNHRALQAKTAFCMAFLLSLGGSCCKHCSFVELHINGQENSISASIARNLLSSGPWPLGHGPPRTCLCHDSDASTPLSRISVCSGCVHSKRCRNNDSLVAANQTLDIVSGEEWCTGCTDAFRAQRLFWNTGTRSYRESCDFHSLWTTVQSVPKMLGHQPRCCTFWAGAARTVHVELQPRARAGRMV